MPNNTYQMVDFREKAPLAATEDMFKDDPMGSKVGGRARYVWNPGDDI